MAQPWYLQAFDNGKGEAKLLFKYQEFGITLALFLGRLSPKDYVTKELVMRFFVVFLHLRVTIDTVLRAF